MNPNAFVGFFKNFYTSDQRTAHRTYKTNTLCGKMQVFNYADVGKYSCHLALTG
jgi:hypothetical protein